MLDEMLKVRTLDSSVAPYLKQEESNHGVAFRDCQTLAKLFEGNRVSWTDYLCPRVALVEAALFQDASVVKFTTQHVACDVVGEYQGVTLVALKLAEPPIQAFTMLLRHSAKVFSAMWILEELAKAADTS